MVLVFSHKKNLLLLEAIPSTLFCLAFQYTQGCTHNEKTTRWAFTDTMNLVTVMPQMWEKEFTQLERQRVHQQRLQRKPGRIRTGLGLINYLSPYLAYLGPLRNLSLFCLLYLACLNRKWTSWISWGWVFNLNGTTWTNCKYCKSWKADSDSK